MANGTMIIAPNLKGNIGVNTGLEQLISNYGYGVTEATRTRKEAQEIRSKVANPTNPSIDKLRTASARQFGRKKEQVGF